MNRLTKVFIVTGLGVSLASSALPASEIWTFRFNSLSNRISTSWHDDLIFHNLTNQDATVRATTRGSKSRPSGYRRTSPCSRRDSGP